MMLKGFLTRFPDFLSKKRRSLSCISRISRTANWGIIKNKKKKKEKEEGAKSKKKKINQKKSKEIKSKIKRKQKRK